MLPAERLRDGTCTRVSRRWRTVRVRRLPRAKTATPATERSLSSRARHHYHPAARRCHSSRHRQAAPADALVRCQKTECPTARKDTHHTTASMRTETTTTRTTPSRQACRRQGERRLWVGACAAQRRHCLLTDTHRPCQHHGRHQVGAARAATLHSDRHCGASSARTGFARSTTGRSRGQADLVHSLRRSRCSGHGAQASQAHTSRGRRRRRSRRQRRGRGTRRT